MARLRRHEPVVEARERFNFTCDVLDGPRADAYATALLAVGNDGVIERQTFRQLGQAAARWSALLRDRGLDSGDRLLVAVDDPPTWAALLLGAIGAGVVPVHTDLSVPDALERVTTHSGARLLVTDRDRLSAGSGLRRAPIETLVVAAVQATLSVHVSAGPSQETFVDEAAVVLYELDTSGGVVTTYDHGFTAELANRLDVWLDVRPGDTVWSAAPAGSDDAVRALLGSLGRGASIILEPRTLPIEEQLDLLARLRVTVLCETPTRLQELTNDGGPVAIAPGLRLVVRLASASPSLAEDESEYAHRAAVVPVATPSPDDVADAWPLAPEPDQADPGPSPMAPSVSRQAAKAQAKEEKRRLKEEERRRKEEVRAAGSATRGEHNARQPRRRAEAKARAADEKAKRTLERGEADRLRRTDAGTAAAVKAQTAMAKAQREVELVEAERRRKTEAVALAEAAARVAVSKEAGPAPGPAAASATTESAPTPESPLVQRLEAYGRNARQSRSDQPTE